MSLKLILIDSARFFWENIRQIVTLCFPFFVVIAVINTMIVSRAVHPDGQIEPIIVLSPMVELALYPIFMVALILLMARRAQREQPTNTQLISDAMGYYFPFLLLSIIILGLICCGFILLIIPLFGVFLWMLGGIWLGVRLAFAQFFLVVDRVDPRTAIVKSFQATRNRFFLIFNALILFGFPILMLNILINQTFVATQAGFLANIVASTIISFLLLFINVILFRIFMQITREDHLEPPPH